MKRVSALLLALLCALCLFACAPEQPEYQEPVPREPNVLNPLFRLRATETQTGPLTRYFATENGFFYLAKTERGYTGGFFVLPALISNEDVLQCHDDGARFFDLGDNKGAVFADGKLYWLTLDAGSSTSYELGGKIAYTDILLGGDGAFYYETEEFLLTAELSFSEDYTSLFVTEKVVMPKAYIRGYQKMLGVSADGQRLYYAYEQDGETGFAYFGIGYRAEELGKTQVRFDSVERVEGTAVLFYERAQGRQTYTHWDLDSGARREISVGAAEQYEGVTVNAQGTFLAGYTKKDPVRDTTGGYLDLYDFESGTRLVRYELADLQINPSLAVSPSGDYLIVGQYDDGSAYDDTGGETVTAIQVAAAP